MPRATRKTPDESRVFRVVVEVPGIEPGSNGAFQILLRAQSRCGAFGLAGSCDPSANTAYVTVWCPSHLRDRGAQQAF